MPRPSTQAQDLTRRSPARRTVFLHGFAGSPRSWEETLRQTRLEATALPLTLPGHGAGPSKRVAPTFPRAARSLWQPLRGLREVDLVGYSLGGRLALAMALLKPQRVRRLILIGTQLGLVGRSTRSARRALDREWARILYRDGLEAFEQQWRQQAIFASQKALEAAARTRQTAIFHQHNPDSLARAIERLSPGRMPNYREELHKLSCPVLLVAGELDAAYIKQMRDTLRSFHDGHIKIVPGAGHNVLLERPVELAACIDAFLR